MQLPHARRKTFWARPTLPGRKLAGLGVSHEFRWDRSASTSGECKARLSSFSDGSGSQTSQAFLGLLAAGLLLALVALGAERLDVGCFASRLRVPAGHAFVAEPC